ncbi:hypothetical protein AAFC00_006300 [Neodothiora populina]|uniref:CASTOR ACT domain-containing protein n=1 Tax=Neodothiora populina TaxID=2781224 RepID=A0ABR3P4R2_9PEZI
MMDKSMSLLNAQVQFLETHVALVHIPLPLYPHFLHPILKLLTLSDRQQQGQDEQNSDDSNDDEESKYKPPRRPWAFVFPFANISVTTVECSIVCPRHLVQELFVPLIQRLDEEARAQISISAENFLVIQIGGEGMEAGQRVLDLTAPLALAGISIFFITSYYNDFILVPQESRSEVVHALEEQGFAFEAYINGHSSAHMTNLSSPLHGVHHHRNTSSTSQAELQPQQQQQQQHCPPGTPPPTTVAEWQTKTFTTLRRKGIEPQIDETLELKTCAGYRSDDQAIQDRLILGITKSLLSGPRFLSITLTELDTVSLTLEKGLLDQFPASGRDILLQDDRTHMTIVLDLRGLPDDSTGIVCGVAGRLIERMAGQGPPFNMSYLSTAKASNVIVEQDEVEHALLALREEEAA